MIKKIIKNNFKNKIKNHYKQMFNSQLGCYQLVTTWMGDCQQTGKPSRYITKANSTRHSTILRGYVNQVLV